MNSTFNRRVRLLAFLFACISLFMCVFVYNSQKTIAIGTETETTYGQTTASVNFRVAPNTDCEIIYEIPVGTKFEILEYSGGWYRVRIDDVVGYVSGDYVFVNESGSRGAYVEKDDTIVYGGPSTASYVVTKLTAGQGINIKAMVGSWCYIVAGSYEGYVDYTTLTLTSRTTAEGNQLRVGMEGLDVKKLQQELYRRGFIRRDEITGVFDTTTRAAVIAFQKLAGLSQDGIAGVNTLNMVYDSSNNIRKDNALYNQIIGTVELFDWFKGGNEWLARYSVFTVTDVRTGLSYKARRFGGWFHADCEPLTAADTAIMYKISGYKWSWDRRPIWITYNGKNVAASQHTMPHMVNPTPSNNFDGHFCIHLLNSKVHENSQVCPRHQACVQEAYRVGKPK